MTIIDRPLQRGGRPDMTKANIKTENDFSDCFNEIQISSDYCSLHDLDLNAEHFTEMHDFNDVNISQLLTKSEPTESVQTPSSRRTAVRPSEQFYSSSYDALRSSDFYSESSGVTRAASAGHNTSKVIGETNQVLSGSSYWDFLSKPTVTSQMAYNLPERPPQAKYSPVQYATCYPATTVHGSISRQPESSNWSSPNPASPESLLPAFSNFNCNVSGLEQSHYTTANPSAVCKDSSSDPYIFPSLSMGIDQSQVVPEPPAYSYQTLSSSPPNQSAETSQMLGHPVNSTTPSSWASPQLPPLHNPNVPYHSGYNAGSNYSSPTGSMSELHTLGCGPPGSSLGLQIPLPMNSSSPSNTMASSIPLNSTSSISRSVTAPQTTVGATYLSHSFPGATSLPHPPSRTNRSASGTGASGTCGNNVCSMPYGSQQVSCQSSPLSQGSPEAPMGCHGSWSDIPMTYQNYVTNGASSVASDLDIDNFYMNEERTSPLGESLPGDMSPLDDTLGSSRRDINGAVATRRVPRPTVRRIRSRSGSHSPKSMELWQFLWVLLAEQNGGGAVVWLDRLRGVFKVVNQVKLCELWSEAKRRNPERTKVTRYSNLTRTLRYYYQRGLMKKGERDHVYQFIHGKIDQWIQTRARSATH